MINATQAQQSTPRQQLATPATMPATPDQATIVNALRQAAPDLWQQPVLLNEVIKGFALSPVPLDLSRKSLALVGLGSYIVNAQSGCGGCHTYPPYAPNGNPFMGQPKRINTSAYLGGGETYPLAGVVSRNLTPENGLPAGRTLAQFVQIMRTGIDLDHAHPQYGPLLQIMPWPEYQGMTDLDLQAIYTYLSAIPSVRAPSTNATGGTGKSNG